MNRSSLQLFGRVVLVTVLVVLTVWLLRRFLPALAWAAVLAIATWPVREWLIDKGVRTSNAAISLTLLVGMLIVGPLVVLAVQIAREAVAFSRECAS
jgi:predicted PurR-regulated permease PerM